MMPRNLVTLRRRGGYFSPVSVVVPTTTWNPLDTNASITLSNGNLTWATTNSAYLATRALASASTGKKYWECHADAIVTAAGALTAAGISNATKPLGSGFLGGDLDGVGWAADGTIYLNGAGIGGVVNGYAAGDTLCIAIDIGAKLMWFRANGGNWNNNVSADPASGTLGKDISAINAGPYFATGQPRTIGDQMTANFGATAYAQAVPSGFGNW